MENLEPIVHITGDNAICGRYVGWAKNKAQTIVSSGVELQTVSFPIVDTQDTKRTNVLITIKINSPFIHIFINSQKSKKLTLTSGLSRSSINYPDFDGEDSFLYFYPRPAPDDNKTTFRAETSLYKANPIKSVYNVESTNFTFDLPYQLKYLNFNVGNQHYLFGSQFTGEMRQVFQLMLATDVEIGYRPYFQNTDGIYTDENGEKHLINISPNGIFTKKLTYNSYSSNVINISIPDGVPIDYSTDTKLLDVDFYTYGNLDNFQGWAFNSDGSEIQNILVATNFGYLETFRVKISITDKSGVLTASYSVEESNKRLYIMESDRFMGSLLDYKFLYHPQNMSNLCYGFSKKGSLTNIPLPYFATITDINSLSFDTDYKSPISVYYNEEDEEQVVYYNIKKVLKNPVTTSDNIAVNSIEDFFQENTFVEPFNGYIKQYGKLTITNDNISLPFNIFNTTISHGFMINDDDSTLSIDNCGDIISEYTVFNAGLNTNTSNNISYRVKTGSLDLADYENFNLDFLLSISKTKVSLINSSINDYKDNFIKTIQTSITTFQLGDFGSYLMDKQQKNLNYYFDSIDIFTVPLLRLNNVTSLLNLDNFPLLNIKDIEYSPFLYEINPSIKDYFDYFTTQRANFESKLDQVNSLINDINTSYNLLVRDQFLDLINYLRAFNDPIQYDNSYINTLIKNLNDNVIPDLNSYYALINTYIGNINSLIATGSDIDNFVLKINEYANFVDQYNYKYFNSNCTNIGVSIVEDFTYTTAISGTIETRTTYYAMQQLSQVNKSISQLIKNRKVINNDFIFNMYDRNSFSIFKQEKTYPDLNYYDSSNGAGGSNLLTNIDYHADTCETNQVRFYKQDNLYDNLTGIYTYVDAIPIDSIAYNFISKSIIDYYGNPHTMEASVYATTPLPSGLITNSSSVFSSNNYYNYHIGDLTVNYTNVELNTTNHYDIKDVECNHTNNQYIATVDKTFKIYSSDKIINVTTNDIIEDDKRFITDRSDSNNPKDQYFTNVKKINDYSGDGSNFFIFSKDAFTFSYVTNKDFYSYNQEQFFLTNITNYPNINYNNNVYSVNYLGMPLN